MELNQFKLMVIQCRLLLKMFSMGLNAFSVKGEKLGQGKGMGEKREKKGGSLRGEEEIMMEGRASAKIKGSERGRGEGREC